MSILNVLRTHAGEPHLLVGDLNSLAPADVVGAPPEGVVPRGEAIEGAARRPLSTLLAAGYVDCFRTLYPSSPGYTCPTHAPWLRLDYIFASQEMAARLTQSSVITDTETALASDHLPIQAVFH